MAVSRTPGDGNIDPEMVDDDQRDRLSGRPIKTSCPNTLAAHTPDALNGLDRQATASKILSVEKVCKVFLGWLLPH